MKKSLILLTLISQFQFAMAEDILLDIPPQVATTECRWTYISTQLGPSEPTRSTRVYSVQLKAAAFEVQNLENKLATQCENLKNEIYPTRSTVVETAYCSFTYDDAMGRYDGSVHVELKARATTTELAQTKLTEQCEELKDEFYGTYAPDMIH